MSTRISAGVDDYPCFTTFIVMIPIDCKITNFSLHLLLIAPNMHQISGGSRKGSVGSIEPPFEILCTELLNQIL